MACCLCSELLPLPLMSMDLAWHTRVGILYMLDARCSNLIVTCAIYKLLANEGSCKVLLGLFKPVSTIIGYVIALICS